MWKISTSEHFQKLILFFALLSGYLSATSLNVIFPLRFDSSYSVLWLHCFGGHRVITRLKFNKIFMIAYITVTCQIIFLYFCLSVESCCKVAGSTLVFFTFL